MKKELGAWNNGKGIDLESWISCTGNYSLAAGYASIFCPKFIEFEDYIFEAKEIDKRMLKNIRDFEHQKDSTPKSVEWVINHLHISDIHHNGCEDLTADKVILLGESLKEIYAARLNYLFPDKPCTVKLYKPEDLEDFEDYQLSFWQAKHD